MMQQQYYPKMQDHQKTYGFAGRGTQQVFQNFQSNPHNPLDEFTSNNLNITSTQNHGQTAVQKLAEPSQMLVHSIVNLINYLDDADLATRALPELIRLLNDEDQVVVSQAAMIAHQLSRKEASRHALCNSASLIKALLQTLESSHDLETSRFTSKILSSISNQQQGLLTIFKTGGIKALIHALSSPVDVVLYNAITTIHNLLLHQEGAKVTVRLNGGLQKMVNLLQKDNYKFLAIVVDCLHMLAYGNQEGKLIILASGGPAELVRILHSYNYEKLLYTAARVIKVLSVCQSNKPALIQAGGVQALAICLDHPSERLAQECLWALRNLSDGATKEINLEPLLQRLVQLLDGTDINMVTCATGTLSNLTCNNHNNKNFVFKAGGVQALIQTIRNAGDRDEITEPAICALRHLTNQYPDAGLAQDAIRVHGGLSDVCKLLDPPSKWPLLAASAGLVRNLAFNTQNVIAMRDLEVIQKLSMLLSKAYQALQETSDGINLAGFKMERVVESSISALHALAMDYQSRSLINDLNLLPTIISLLYHGNENIIIVALDLLTELAKGADIAPNMDSQGGVQAITGLLASPSEAIRQRAALLLSIVSSDKTPEYTQRLSNEINTLFQTELHDGSQWIEAPNQDIPSVYTVEGQMQPTQSIHADSGRQNIYYTGSNTYMTQHDMDVSGYGRTGQIIPQNQNQLAQSLQARVQTQNQQQSNANEPWFDTDL